MRCQVIEFCTVSTSRGELELKPGQMVSLPQKAALQLLSQWKVVPVEKVAQEVYSTILKRHIWVVTEESDMKALRVSGIKEPIYTADEIRKLKSVSSENLRVIEDIKEIFEYAIVEKVEKKD